MLNAIRHNTIPLLASAAVAVAGLLVTPAPGQPPTNPPGKPAGALRPPSPGPPERMIEPASGPIISVDFPGGTVRQYLQAIEKAAAPEPVNVSLPDEAADVRLPHLVLKNVSIGTAVEALRWAFAQNSGHQFSVEDFNRDPGSAAVYAIRYQHFDPAQRSVQTGMTSPKQLEVFSIRDLLQPPPGADEKAKLSVTAETILTAVDALLSMVPQDKGDQPQVKFHSESGVLLVRAPESDMQAVRNLIGEIAGDLQRRREEFHHQSKAKETEDFARQRAEIQLGVARRALENARNHLAQVKKVVDSGAAPHEDLAAAEFEVATKEALVRQAELDAQEVAVRGELSGSGSAEMEIAGLRRRVEELTAMVAKLQEALAKQHGGKED